MTVIESPHVDLLAVIEQEKKRNEESWTTEQTDVRVNPRLMLDLEKQDCDSPLHQLLKWKDITTVYEVQECLDEFERILTSPDENNVEEKERFHKDLEQVFPDIITQDRRATMILDLRSRLFDKRVEIKRHVDFPSELFMVDLTFLPENFFYDDSHELLRKYYTACCKGDSTVAPRMKTSHMRYCNASSKDPGQQLHQDFTFPGDKSHTECLQSIFSELLQKYAGMPEYSVFEWAVSFLFTVEESQQDPHVDYKHTTMNSYLARHEEPKVRGRKRKSMNTEERPSSTKIVDLPWSLDMPLMKGGMRLAFYGSEDGKLLETPQVIHVPFRHALFWRGDCVHAGCLADMLGGHGFRMHAYIPLKTDQRHMMLTTLPEIEWHDKKKHRYSQRLRRYDGKPFEGNERV